MNTQEEVKRTIAEDYFSGLTKNEKISVYEEYASCNNLDTIYCNDDDTLDELFASPSEAINAVLFGDYRKCDEFFKFNGYMNLESGDFEDLAEIDSYFYDWLCENNARDFDSDLFADYFADFAKGELQLTDESEKELFEQYMQDEFIADASDDLESVIDEIRDFIAEHKEEQESEQ